MELGFDKKSQPKNVLSEVDSLKPFLKPQQALNHLVSSKLDLTYQLLASKTRKKERKRQELSYVKEPDSRVVKAPCPQSTRTWAATDC